jgi:chlorite dismutase
MEKEREGPRRQYISFGFYRVLPEWRRLPLAERQEHRCELAAALRQWCQPGKTRVLPYSMVGMTGGADFMLWRISYSLEALQDMASDVRRTRLGGYLETPCSYLGMTLRSQFAIDERENGSPLRSTVRPGEHRFLFVFPLVRTRSWYLLPFEDRQRCVNEMVKISQEFPHTNVHVTYSFGLDSQDFVIAIETDHPDALVERTMRLREAESSAFVQSDTPVFTCIQRSLEDTLERLG